MATPFSVSRRTDTSSALGVALHDGTHLGPEWVSGFHNRRGTAERHIREGKYAIRWTRLSCRRFRDNEVRLQLHALAYNLAVFLANVGLPEPMADWSPTSLQLKLTRIIHEERNSGWQR